MNYFYDLPQVLQEKILDIRDNYMANMIQKLWFRYNARCRALISLSKNCYDEIFNLPNASGLILDSRFCEKTAEIIEYIAKKLTEENQNNSSYYSNKWYNFLNDISEALDEEDFYPGLVSERYYNRVENAYNTIIIKMMFRKMDNISKIKGFRRITWRRSGQWNMLGARMELIRPSHDKVIYCPLLSILK